jgi:prepilin-type N-terminal cleavage/methylation domain-containing protein
MMIRQDQRGLTVMELLVALVVGGLMSMTITTFALRYWSNTAVLQNNEQALVSRLNAGDYLRSLVNSSNGLIVQNDIPDTHTLNADPANVSGAYWLPIHALPGTTSIGSAGTYTPVIYLDRPSINTSKAIVMNGTAPYQDNVLLYMDGTNKQFKARVLANPNATANAAKTTCPPANATNACPADSIIAENVSSVGVRYFSKSGNTIDYSSIKDPVTGANNGPDFPSVEVLEITINLSKKAKLHNGANTTNQTIIRVALRN